MKSISNNTALGLALILTSHAIAREDDDDAPELSASVLEAIREFNERANRSPNEILVVLDPPDEEITTPEADGEATEGEQTEGDSEEDPEEEMDDIVAAILTDEPESETTAEAQPPTTGQTQPHGPQVRVQSLRDTDRDTIDADDIEISAPFAAKPLGNPPAGWKLVPSPDAAEYSENVEVTPGTWLTLSIRPHVLIPDADGRDVFHLAEPGYDPTQGYRQQSTVSSAISSSIRQLENDARVLNKVIDELEQILISLPRPATLPTNDEETEP